MNPVDEESYPCKGWVPGTEANPDKVKRRISQRWLDTNRQASPETGAGCGRETALCPEAAAHLDSLPGWVRGELPRWQQPRRRQKAVFDRQHGNSAVKVKNAMFRFLNRAPRPSRVQIARIAPDDVTVLLHLDKKWQ